jgi:hypothetical protein
MSLRRAPLSLALIALGLLLSACVLRPRYKDMVQPAGSAQQAAEGQTLSMRLVEPATGQPIKGAKVIAGSGHSRLAATSDDQGRIAVPVAQALLEENPLVEVVLPKGVKSYQFQILRPEPPPAPPAPPEPPAPPSPPPEPTNSTGSVAPGNMNTPETPPVPPPSTGTAPAGH